MGLFDNILKEVGKELGKAIDNKIKTGNNDFTSAINTALQKKDEIINGTTQVNQTVKEEVKETVKETVEEKKTLVQGEVYNYNAPHNSPYGSGNYTDEKIKNDGDTPIKPYKKYEGFTGFDNPEKKTCGAFSIEIPENFLDFDSGAAEVSNCFMYTPETITDDNLDDIYEEYYAKNIHLTNPIISMYNQMNAMIYGVKGYVENGVPGANPRSKEYISVWEDVKGKCGKMLFKAKVENYYDKVLYFYGFTQVDEIDNYTQEMGLTLEYSKDIVDTPLEAKLHKILEHVAQTYTEYEKVL